MESPSEQPHPEAAPPPQKLEPPPPPASDTPRPPHSGTPSSAAPNVQPSSSASAAADPSSAPCSSQNPSQTPQSQSQLQQPVLPPRPSSLATGRPQAPFPHFVHHFASASSSPSPSPSGPQPSTSSAGPSRPIIPSLASSTASAATTMPRGGLAIGVPAHGAHISRPQQSPMSFTQFGQSPSFSQPFGSMPRVPEQSVAANPQARPPIQGIQNIGMIGSLSTATQMRPSGSSNPQQRLGQPPLRAPPPSSNQTFNSQKISGPTLLRSTSIAPSSSSPLSQQQLASPQGKQMHAPSGLRPQVRPHVLQQRTNNLQQPSHSLATTSTPQQTPTSQQQQQPQKLHQPFQLQQQLQQQQQQQQQQKHQLHQQQQVLHQPQDPNQQSVQLRNQQPIPQQQPMRPFGPSTVRPNAQAGTAQSGTTVPVVNAEGDGSGRILSKRSIHELINQIDPYEKLDSEVEDVLIDIAEDFVESVATFACSLAKHRKSTTLETRDILLHVERNWNITIPGFSGDDIRGCKKQITNDIHKERLSVVKRSMLATSEANTSRTPGAGHATANQKGQASKAPL